MTESNDHSWVWSALAELVGLTAKHDEAVTEAERLAGCVRDEMERIQGATGLSGERLGEMVEGMRVIGPPLGSDAVTPDPSVPAASSAAAAGDPLAIPKFLQRGETTGAEGSGADPEQAAPAAAAPPET